MFHAGGMEEGGVCWQRRMWVHVDALVVELMPADALIVLRYQNAPSTRGLGKSDMPCIAIAPL